MRFATLPNGQKFMACKCWFQNHLQVLGWSSKYAIVANKGVQVVGIPGHLENVSCHPGWWRASISGILGGVDAISPDEDEFLTMKWGAKGAGHWDSTKTTGSLASIVMVLGCQVWEFPEMTIARILLENQKRGKKYWVVKLQILLCSSYFRKMNPFWRSYFSKGLKPPTRITLKQIECFVEEWLICGIWYCFADFFWRDAQKKSSWVKI